MLMVKKMNSREEFFTEFNALKVLVWQLWEESHNKIEKNDWIELKKGIEKKMRNSEKSV